MLVAATVLLAVGAGVGWPASIVGLAIVCALTGLVLLGRGRLPFLAAVLIALTDLMLLFAAT